MMSVEAAMDSLVVAHKNAHAAYDLYVEKHGEVTQGEGGPYVRILSHENCHQYGVLERRLDRVHAAQRAVPQSFLAALVGRFDALVGGLVRELFRLQPDALNCSEREFTFAQLVKFDSIDAARKYVVEKEIETLLRKSHSEQFEWLEKKFDIQLRKDLPVWSAFVEITERRSLFVHTDGVASAQYISNCQLENVPLPPETKVGSRLWANQDYFRRAQNVLGEIGVKLSQVLWRKVAPGAASLLNSPDLI